MHGAVYQVHQHLQQQQQHAITVHAQRFAPGEVLQPHPHGLGTAIALGCGLRERTAQVDAFPFRSPVGQQLPQRAHGAHGPLGAAPGHGDAGRQGFAARDVLVEQALTGSGAGQDGGERLPQRVDHRRRHVRQGRAVQEGLQRQ